MDEHDTMIERSRNHLDEITTSQRLAARIRATVNYWDAYNAHDRASEGINARGDRPAHVLYELSGELLRAATAEFERTHGRGFNRSAHSPSVCADECLERAREGGTAPAASSHPPYSRDW